MVKIAIGADHGGFELKRAIAAWLAVRPHAVIDCGATDFDPADDFPDFCIAVSEKIQSGEAERGIVICGSGVGASVACSKHAGVRAATCHDRYSAHQGVEHDAMNVLCLGGRVIGIEPALEIVEAFLDARFDPQERFLRRLRKVDSIERAAEQ